MSVRGPRWEVWENPDRDYLIVFTNREALEGITAFKQHAAKLARALETIAQFRGQLTPDDHGGKTNFATAVAIAEAALEEGRT